MVSFEEQMLIILIKSNLFFSFMDHAFGVISMKLRNCQKGKKINKNTLSWNPRKDKVRKKEDNH